MNRPLLERRSPLGISYALLILTVFFFLIPSAFRAARLSLGQKENDIKDWLPSDFPETAELEWFADHFVGESFVLATWPGCTSGDKRLALLESKLRHESEQFDPSVEWPAELVEQFKRAKAVGQELQLLSDGNDHYNWGGRREKWLRSPSGLWHYITPDGRLYRWEEPANGPAAAVRTIKKLLGRYELKGQFVTAFGKPPGARIANPFYNDLSLICAPLFHSVQTGESIAGELSREGGALWPIDLTDENRRKVVAQRRAMQRLTGTLFAPAVPEDFPWTAAAFREAVPTARRDQLPQEFEADVEAALTNVINERFAGSLAQLSNATTDEKSEVWYEVFDSVQVEPPPRLTCVLVTLTDLAKDNLAFAVGRGVMGGPRGRLLQLAEESGVAAAPAPSMAPPPFDRKVAESLAGLPPLRMGGPPIDNIAIDEEGTITLVRLVGYSVLLGIVLSYLCFGSIKITIMVFIVGGSAAILSMGIVWWAGGTVDAILMSMPSLVYVLGLSGAIHVINYYRDEVRARGQSGAAGRALRHALLPCTLASATTAIGLASLFTSNLAPISNFGLYSAIGVIATLGILFSYLPAALQTFAPAMDRVAPGETGDPPRPDQPRLESRLSDWWAGVGRWITRHHVLVSSSCIAVLLLASTGLRKMETSVQLLKLFDQDSRIIHDYAWLERNFGKLVPMEVIVRVPPAAQSETYGHDDTSGEETGVAKVDMPAGDDAALAAQSFVLLERAEIVSRIRAVIRRTLGESGKGVVGQAMSAETFLPPLPAPSNGYSPIRTRFNRELIESRDELLASDYLRLEKSGPYAGSELWRISLRVGALSDVDYGLFISTLRNSVEPVIRAYDVRDELVRKLATSKSGELTKLSGKDRVVVVGCERPATLAEIELVSEDRARIDTNHIFLATLGELLSGEPIKRPVWIDPSSDNSPVKVGSEKWQQMIAAVDAVVWTGGGGISKVDLAGASRLIDARSIRDKSVRPILAANKVPDVAGAESLQVVYTGIVPVVYKAQRTLLNSLAQSIGLAFVMITAVMIVLLNPGRFPMHWLRPGNFGNGFAAGAVSMIPNVFPVLFVFGLMGHAGIAIDIGTMMTASVAMGVAVDDTIHFLSWFRAHLDRGMNRVEAVIETYRRVGPAMTQTTIVGGLGLFVFALSTFTPTQRFGTLMLILLATALVGDLILLPALLVGPLGRCFKPREGVTESDSKEPNPHQPDDAGSPPSGQKLNEAFVATVPLKVHFPNSRADSPHRIRRR